MQGVDTYKNQTAEMIEGGISGVVNLRTRTPFDSDGQAIALTGRANYGDLSEEPTYEASGVYSNNWDTDSGPLRRAGERGVLEHPDAHRSRQHDAHQHVLLGLSAGRWRVSERGARCRRQRRLQRQSLRRHRLALRARPGELLAGGLRPHAHRRGAHAAVRERRQEPADGADRRLLQVRKPVAGAQRQHQLAGRRGLRHAGVGAVQRDRRCGRSPATSPSARTACSIRA